MVVRDHGRARRYRDLTDATAFRFGEGADDDTPEGKDLWSIRRGVFNAGDRLCLVAVGGDPCRCCKPILAGVSGLVHRSVEWRSQSIWRSICALWLSQWGKNLARRRARVK